MNNGKKKDFSTQITTWIGTPLSIWIHTIVFLAIFSLYFFGVSLSIALLILTTLLSVEAIYLALFIQLTINRHEKELKGISADTDEILEDTEDILEDTSELTEEEK